MINQILLIFTVVLIYEFLKFVRIIHIVKSNLFGGDKGADIGGGMAEDLNKNC